MTWSLEEVWTVCETRRPRMETLMIRERWNAYTHLWLTYMGPVMDLGGKSRASTTYFEKTTVIL